MVGFLDRNFILHISDIILKFPFKLGKKSGIMQIRKMPDFKIEMPEDEIYHPARLNFAA